MHSVDSGVRHLTASEVAELFSVDPKTIHNWVGAGKLKGWRTPGRHLRFDVTEVADACTRMGRDVPRWLADAVAGAVIEDAAAARSSGPLE